MMMTYNEVIVIVIDIHVCMVIVTDILNDLDKHVSVVMVSQICRYVIMP